MESTVEPAMETVARREWVIRELDGDDAVMEQLPEGDRVRFRADLLPDDVGPGDRFRIVAQVDRRETADEAPEVPDAVGEAIRNLAQA